MGDAPQRPDDIMIGTPRPTTAPGRQASAPPSAAAAASVNVPDDDDVSRLLARLWHGNLEIRQAAAAALPTVDGSAAPTSGCGYFGSAFLRGLDNGAESPESDSGRFEAVVDALRGVLRQSVSELRAMSNMSYSFLSSALYLAVLGTCHDALCAVRRLRAAAAHPELCALLRSLAAADVTRRVNAHDADLLARIAGRALAALPPDEIPEFWRELTHPSPARRRTVVAALALLDDPRAVPHLLRSLPGQQPPVAERIVVCLGRLGDPGALPALKGLLRSRHRGLRQQARAAIAAIERANAGTPARTLLRPVHEPRGGEARHLLRPAPAGRAGSPSEMPHVSGDAAPADPE